MPYGYAGQILRINLTNNKISIEKPDENFYRTYIGGKGFIGYFLTKEVPKDTDPLGKENKLIFATGVLTGVPIAGMPRYAVGAKSPLTDGFGQSEAGGFWGPELKKAGYDAVIIEGKADQPVYIHIKDDVVDIKDASHLWGKETGDVQDLVIDELKDKQVKIAQIGPGGENLVKYACITNNLKHYNGRNGMGAVMGSKNLRAIAVRGTKKIEFADSAKLASISKEYLSNFMNNPLSRGLYDFGTSGAIATLNTTGLFPSKNFKYGENEYAEGLTGQELANTIMSKREGCYACAVKCKRVIDVDDEDVRIDPKFGGPEYETIAGFGAVCLTGDLKSVSKANELCNRFGLDTITTSVTIGFAMECFEKGLLTEEDTQGIQIRFQDKDVVYQLIEMIAKREGIGNLLAEGSYRAAEKVGKGSEAFLMTSKKQEYALHDPRGKTGLAYAYATAGNATDHMYSIHDNMIANKGEILDRLSAIGLLDPIEVKDVSWRKARAVKTISEWTSFQNCAGMCILVFAPRGTISLNTVAEILRAATGWEYTSVYEIMKAGERSINLARMFNMMQGLSKKDDELSQRSYELMDNEKAPKYLLDKKAFKEGLDIFYEMRGWTKEGIPTKGKLYDLNLDWLVETLDEIENR